MNAHVTPSAETWFHDAMTRSMRSAIEEEVTRRMPEIVSMACAKVTANMSSFLSYERMGADLRITVLNAYKPEDKK